MCGKTSSEVFREAIPNVANSHPQPEFVEENKNMSDEKTKNQEPDATREKMRADENAVCESCGRFGAYQFGDQYLCADCYQEQGSCCALESNKDWSTSQ